MIQARKYAVELLKAIDDVVVGPQSSEIFRNLQNLESCTFPETYTIKGVNEDQ